jgi:hypothetical protein
MIRRDVLWESTNIAGLELLGRKLPVVLGLSRHSNEWQHEPAPCGWLWGQEISQFN